MDTQEIAAGATLYLPVFQRGALLAIGDVHAAMGDGEVCVTGCEVAASVVVEVDVLKGRAPTWPTLETDDAVYILVSLPTIGEALVEATRQGVRSLERARRTSFEDALHPFGLGDGRAGQPAGRSQQDGEGRHPEAPARRGGL